MSAWIISCAWSCCYSIISYAVGRVYLASFLRSLAGLSNPTSHWAFERLLSISLVPSMFLGCFVDNVFVDVAIGAIAALNVFAL